MILSIGPESYTHSIRDWLDRSDHYLKPKDLIGIPWMVAFALRSDGWVLRSDNVWAKGTQVDDEEARPRGMPESIEDRPRRNHESVFMFSKARWVGPQPGRFSFVSEQDARWLALLFDTEGNITIGRGTSADASGGTKVQYSARISAANISRPLLEKAQQIAGGAGSILQKKGLNAPIHYWQFAAQEAKDMLLLIYPHLIVKRRQARLAICMQEGMVDSYARRGRDRKRDAEYTAFLEKCWATGKALNKCREVDTSWIPEPGIGHWTSQPYFYDWVGVREKALTPAGTRAAKGGTERGTAKGVNSRMPNYATYDGYRNLASVWWIPPQPSDIPHYALMPPELAERCIRSGTSEHGACGACGEPYRRVLERIGINSTVGPKSAHLRETGQSNTALSGSQDRSSPVITTVGYAVSCGHDAPVVPCRVLDPFGGAGTTALVAARLGRDAALIELSPAHASTAQKRLEGDLPMFVNVRMA